MSFWCAKLTAAQVFRKISRRWGRGARLRSHQESMRSPSTNSMARWRAVGGDAAVEEAGDVGVLEPGEDLPLFAKALVEQRRPDGAGHHLDGHLLADFAIGANGAV